MNLLKLALLSSILFITACSSIDAMFGPIDSPPTEIKDAALSKDASNHESLASQNQNLKAEIVVLRQEVKVLLGVIKRLNAAEQARLAAGKAPHLQAVDAVRLQAEETTRLQAEEAARLQAEEAAHLQAEEAAHLQAEEAAHLQAEEAARLQAEEAARLQAEEEARSQAVPADRLWVTVSVRPGFRRLTKQTHDTLAKLAAQFMSRPRAETLEIRGYTDDEPVGGYEGNRRKPTHPFKTNIALSEARARSVANALIEAGIPKDKIRVQGYGAKDFIAGNKTVKGRAQNRRVEIHLIKQ